MKAFISLALLTSVSAFAQSASYELTCRAKAKEVAADTYRGCITENKKVHIEQLRSDYQQKLRALKDEYDQEVKKLTGASANSTPAEASVSSASTPIKKSNTKSKVAKRSTLPAKKRSERSLVDSTPTTDDLTVQLKPASNEYDDSSMDIPEPVPVENVQDMNSNNG